MAHQPKIGMQQLQSRYVFSESQGLYKAIDYFEEAYKVESGMHQPMDRLRAGLCLVDLGALPGGYRRL